jgi:hypothetical protein
MNFLYKFLVFLGVFVGISSTNSQATNAKPDIKSASSAFSLRELGKEPVLHQTSSLPAINKMMERYKKLPPLTDYPKVANQHTVTTVKSSLGAEKHKVAAMLEQNSSQFDKEKAQEIINFGVEYILKNDEESATRWLQAAADRRNSSLSALYKEAIKQLEAQALAGDLKVCKRLIEIYTNGFGAIKSEIGNALRFKLLMEKGQIAVSQNQGADQVDELNDEDWATVLQKYYPDESDDQ